MRYLKHTIAGLMFVSVPARAEMTALKDFTPVAFTRFVSEIPDEQAAPIMEALSSHISRTLVKVYATETIGFTADVTPKMDLAVLGSLGFAVGEVDRAIDQKVMPEIRPVLRNLPEGKSMRFSVEILWADRATADKLPHIAYINDTVLEALKASGRPDLAGLMSLRWVDIDTHDRDGKLRAKLRSSQALGQARAATYNEWTPWDTKINLEVTRNGIALMVNALTLPARIEDLKQRKKPGILIERVIYSPQMSRDAEIDLTRILLDRRYSTSGEADDSRVRFQFGRWDGNQFAACMGESCLRFVNRVPTIHGVVQFEEHSWYQSIVGWFRSWFATHVEVRILLKDLFLTYDRGTQRFVVVPDKSQIPIVVKSVDSFGNQSRYLVDTDTQVMGVNFYERYVGSQITDGLSSDLNRSVREADKGLSDLIGQIAGSLAR